MIGKPIKRKKGIRSSIRRLNDYITNANGKGFLDHKVMFASALNCGDVDTETATLMMECDAQQNKRCKDPVLHCLLSWREGEQPNEEQTREAVKIALEELGLVGQPCVYALHKDTDNYHLHISVSKIDRTTYKAIDPAHGWTEKAMERAARRVEFEQGWEVEKNAWTTYDKEKISQEEPKLAKKEGKIPQTVRDIERQTGEKSAQRIAKDALKDVRPTSWEELHRTLADMNMRYEKKGSGAVIFVGDTPVKASSAGKRFALSHLEKQLGEFKEAPRTAQIKFSGGHVAEPLMAKSEDVKTWETYSRERSIYYGTKRDVKREMRERIEKERKELAERQKRERDEFFRAQDWKGRRRELNMQRSKFAAKHKKEKLALAERHAEMKKRFGELYPTFCPYEEWLRMNGKDREADDLRLKSERDRVTNSLMPPPDGQSDNSAEIRDLRGFECREHKAGLLFIDQRSGRNSFIDTGKAIRVFANDDAALVASMQLAVQKWGRIQLGGTDEYKQKCLALAVENGIKIENPELQEDYKKLLAEKKAREQHEKKSPPETDSRREAFERYHEAVGADRYRVTATQMREDGSRRGFRVDIRDGAPDGFTAEELAKKMPRMASLEQNDNRNIYYTPVSEDKHHILVDDMTNETLAQFLTDGYEPAVIIESSPGNWQAVITIPKLGTDIDREVGNAIVAKLNKEYGDPKLSGEVHAHRAPGFENRKPKHQREDGTYPATKLVKAERVECEKTAKLAHEIFAELEMERSRTKAKIRDIAPPHGEAGAPAAMDAYQKHFKDVLRVQQRIAKDTEKMTDASRIDAMVAIRLRMTGHSREDIKTAVEVMSPRMREAIGASTSHQWNDYAERTAKYAFGPVGDRELARYSTYAEKWQKIEHPEPPARRPEPRAPQRSGKRREAEMER